MARIRGRTGPLRTAALSGLLILSFAMLSFPSIVPAAHAQTTTSITTSNGGTVCPGSLGGTWSGTTCTISGQLTVASGTTLNVGSGVTIKATGSAGSTGSNGANGGNGAAFSAGASGGNGGNGGNGGHGVFNAGTIINDGTISVSGGSGGWGGYGGSGGNPGTGTLAGATGGNGGIGGNGGDGVSNGGTINNYGAIDAQGGEAGPGGDGGTGTSGASGGNGGNGGYGGQGVYNVGTINNHGTITGTGGSAYGGGSGSTWTTNNGGSGGYGGDGGSGVFNAGTINNYDYLQGYGDVGGRGGYGGLSYGSTISGGNAGNGGQGGSGIYNAVTTTSFGTIHNYNYLEGDGATGGNGGNGGPAYVDATGGNGGNGGPGGPGINSPGSIYNYGNMSGTGAVGANPGSGGSAGTSGGSGSLGHGGSGVDVGPGGYLSNTGMVKGYGSYPDSVANYNNYGGAAGSGVSNEVNSQILNNGTITGYSGTGGPGGQITDSPSVYNAPSSYIYNDGALNGYMGAYTSPTSSTFLSFDNLGTMDNFCGVTLSGPVTGGPVPFAGNPTSSIACYAATFQSDLPSVVPWGVTVSWLFGTQHFSGTGANLTVELNGPIYYWYDTPVTYTGVSPGVTFYCQTGCKGSAYVGGTGTFVATYKSDSSTTVTCNPSTFTYGVASTCTATVTGLYGPAGYVNFTVSGSTGTLSPSNGRCLLFGDSCSVTYTLTNGLSPFVTALYSGDAALLPSEGYYLAETTLAPTTTSVSCSPSSLTVASLTTCTATVAGGFSPTGTVSFFVSELGGGTFSPSQCTLSSSGSCSVEFKPAATGTMSVTAIYYGDSHNRDSNGAFDLTVTSVTTAASVSCSPSPVISGSSATCGVTVAVISPAGTGIIPTGTVTLTTSGTGSFASPDKCTLTSGFCSIDYTPSSTGPTVITALYGGDQVSAPSLGTFTLSVLAETTTSVSCQPQSLAPGSTSFCGVTVTGLAPDGGIVTFTSSSPTGVFYPPQCIINAGFCPFSYTDTALGSPAISATYQGNLDNAPSTGAYTLLYLTQPTTTVSCSPSSVSLGSSVTCTATVAGSSPTGAVDFFSSGSGTFSPSSAQCTLSSGSCSVSYTPVSAGAVTVSASYQGDYNNLPGGGTFGLAVTEPPSATSVTCSPLSVLVGSSTTCEVTVAGSSPTGDVNFTAIGGTGTFSPSDQCFVDYGICAVTYTPASAGPVSINASYSGDSHNAASYGTFSLTVANAASTTSVVCSPASVVSGSPTTCTATVTGSSPAGDVNFTSSSSTGAFSSNQCTLSASGSCSVSYSDSTEGSHTIRAIYGGDVSNLGSSGTFSLTIGSLVSITTSNGGTVCVPAGTLSSGELPGSWTQSNSTCTLSPAFTLPSGYVLDIGAGVTVSSTSGSAFGITNSGIINNYGTIIGNYDGPVNGPGGNDAGVDNFGVINNAGIVNGTGANEGILVETGGAITNDGSMTGASVSGYGILNGGIVNNAGSMTGIGTFGFTNFAQINDYCSGTLTYSTYLNSPPNPNVISCYKVTFDQSGIPSGVAWGVTASWSPASGVTFLSLDHTGTGSSVAMDAIGSLTYAYDSPVTSPGATNDCTAGCAGSATIAADASFAANYNGFVAPSTTSVSCSPSLVSTTSSSTCTATVTGSTPTGLVSFTASAGSLSPSSGQCVLSSSSSCSVTYSGSVQGFANITASYSGDVNNLGSSGSFSLTVKLASTTSVSCSPSTVSLGSSATCTVTVVGGGSTPTGLVSFTASAGSFSPSSAQCNLSSSSGSCAVSYSGTTSGFPTVTASYGGDSNYAPSSGAAPLTVPQTTSATVVSCSPSLVGLGSSATCTATVTGFSPTGTVTFASSSSGGSFSPSSDQCTLSAGSCSVSYSDTAPGSALITAVYHGDSSNKISSGAASLKVGQPLSAGILSATRNPVDVNQLTTISTSGASGGTGPGTYSYAWSAPQSGCSPSTTASFSCTPSSASGSPFTVTLTVTDSNGDVASATLSLTVYPAVAVPAPSVTQSPADVGQSVTFTASPTGGSGAYSTYLWTGLPAGCTASSSPTVSCAPTSSFGSPFSVQVAVTDSNGETVTSAALSFTVAADPTVAVTPAGPLSYESGQSAATLSAAVTYTGPNTASVEWYSSPSSSCSSSSIDTGVSGLSFSPGTASAGTTFYCAVVSDSGVSGYRSTSNVLEVVVGPALTASISPSSATIDAGGVTSASFNLTTAGGSGGNTYAWSYTGLTQSSGCGSNDLTCTVTASSSGSFSVSVTVTDSSGGNKTSDAAVTVNQAVTASVAPSSASIDADGITHAAFTLTTAGGSGGDAYSWSLSAGLTASSGCGSGDLNCEVVSTTAGSGSVSVTVTDSIGGTATSNAASVTVSSALTASLSPSSAAIDADGVTSATFTLSTSGGSGGNSYAWSHTGLTAESGCGAADTTCRVTAGTAGTFYVSVNVTDSNGGTKSSSSAAVTVSFALTASVSPASATIYDDGVTSATFTLATSGGSGSNSYSWSYTGLTAASGCGAADAGCTVTASSTGTFTVSVTATDSNGGVKVSNAATVTAIKMTTSAAVTCSPSPGLTGSSVECTATVTDAGAGAQGTPTGAVTFSDTPAVSGLNLPASCTLSPTGTAGAASCAVSFIPASGSQASYAIAASYGGDSYHDGSSGSSALVVEQPGTTAQGSSTTQISGGDASSDQTSTTGVGVTISGSSASAGTNVTITTEDLSSPSQDVGISSLLGTEYYDVSVFGVADGTANVCITPASSSATLEYWTGTSWAGASDISMSGSTICGGIPVSALTGTNIAVGTPRTTVTSLSCTPSFVVLSSSSAAVTCTVTVTDTSLSPVAPAGTVTIAVTSPSSPPSSLNFPSANTCTLAADASTPGVATCSLAPFVPGQGSDGSYILTASYPGDLSHGSSSGTSALSVVTPSEAIQGLVTVVNGMNLPHGIANSLVSKLDAASSSLAKGNTNAAVNQLNAFVNDVNAQTGKAITADQALTLTSDAQAIIAALS